MVPAWHEYDVVAAMIEDMVRVMDYRNYVVFVGTYQNDPQTIAEVERMRRRYKQLRRVEVPHDGPTCKADCLNWVIQAIFKLRGRSRHRVRRASCCTIAKTCCIRSNCGSSITCCRART